MDSMDYKQFLKKHKLKEGELIEVSEESRVYEGYLVPSKDPDLLVLKLKNGYNVGLEIKKIKKVEKLAEEKHIGKAKPTKVERNPSLPTISILHTGGTIASRVDYRTGGVYASFTAEDLVTMLPEITKIANINSIPVTNVMSENMRFEHYKLMIKAAEKEIKNGVKGIIIGHGTDTLGYSVAALSFALEDCPVPVILVGAQRSSDRGSSDAAMNLICAAEFIAKTDFSGVAICMHDSSADDICAILPATKTRKMHTSRRDAFKAVNDSPIAKVNYKTRGIEFIKKDYEKVGSKKLVVKDRFEQKVALVKTYPNMNAEQLLFFKRKKYKGVVIEGTGLGHTPIGKNDEFIKAIKALVEAGIIVVITSQCIYGRVNPTVYTNLRKVSGAGAIYGEDMLPETAFIKLAWLLGNYPKAKVKELVGKNLRGEITPCTRIDSFDLE